MFERDDELAALREAVGAARGGKGQAILVTAAAGLGKTTLLDAARLLAEDSGFRCLAARGSELERDFPFGAVRQLLDPILLTAATHGGSLSEAADAAALLLDPDSGMGDGAEPNYTQLHAVYWLLATLALERPLLVIVDDAHWLDMASLRFLIFLARRLETLPFLLLVAARPGESADEALLAELTHRGVELRLMPLTRAAVTAMVSRCLGVPVDEPFARACAAMTHGNPFYLRAMLAELSEQGVRPIAGNVDIVHGLCPADAVRYLQRRLFTLPEHVTAVAAAVAVLGDGSEADQVVVLTGLSPLEVATAAQVLGQVGIFVMGGALAFVHPLARAAVQAGLGSRGRAELHGRVARLLFTTGAAPERIAAHILEIPAGSWSLGLSTLRRAAEDAAGRGAPQAAVVYLRRALQEPTGDAENAELLADLGRYEAQAGQPEAPDRLRRALTCPQLSPTQRAETALMLSRIHVTHLLGLDAVRVLTEQADRLAEHPQVAARLHAELLGVANVDLSVRRVVDEWATRLAGTCPAEGPLAVALAAYRAVDATVSGQSAATAAAYAAEALADGSLRQQAARGGQNFGYISHALVFAERWDDCTTALEIGLNEARAAGSAASFTGLSLHRGFLHLRLGRLADAEADASLALETARLNDYNHLELLAISQLAEITIETGQPSDVLGVLAESWVDEAASCTAQASTALETRGRLRLAGGDTEAGVRDLRRAGAHFERWGLYNPAVYRWRSNAALGLAHLGDTDRASALALAELQRAQTWGAPGTLGVALRAVGLLERGERRLEILAEAANVLAESGAALEHARVLVDLGAALRRTGRRREARATLRSGLELAIRCGATLLIRRARAEVRAAGGRPTAPVHTGVNALTASERRIAEFAASGCSNPEIARSLFITIKTVEMHLSSVYRKLGVHSRAELPGSMAPA